MNRQTKEHPTKPTPPQLPVPQQSQHQPLPAPAPPPSLRQYAPGINPIHYAHPQYVNVEWSSGICAYCSDIPNCCVTCWCPCITFGHIAEIVDKGNSSCVVQGAIYACIEAFTGCACIYSSMYRSKIRNQFGLRGSTCGDCFLHICCERRALCQEYRELKHRVFDLSMGWHGNKMGLNHGALVPPIAPGGMHR